MRLDRFTLRGQEAVEAAIKMAEKAGHQQVEPEHLLLALVDQAEGLTRPIFGKIGANANALRLELETAIKKFPNVTGAQQQYYSSRTNTIFSQAQKEADALKDEYLSTEHLLIAIADEKNGESGRLMRAHGVR